MSDEPPLADMIRDLTEASMDTGPAKEVSRWAYLLHGGWIMPEDVKAIEVAWRRYCQGEP